MDRYTKNKTTLVNSMLDRFGYLVCQKCGKNKCGMKFETHHIVFRSEAPNHPELNNIKNLIICGSDCHKEAPDSYHKNKSQRNHLVKHRNLEKLFDMNLII